MPASKANGSTVGPGLGSLLQGTRQSASAGARKPASTLARPETASRPARSLRWTLLAADALLVVLACWLVFGKSQPLNFWELALCVSAVGLAACLGCWAVALGGPR